MPVTAPGRLQVWGLWGCAVSDGTAGGCALPPGSLHEDWGKVSTPPEEKVLVCLEWELGG